MTSSDVVSFVALLFSVLATMAAVFSWLQAKRSNDETFLARSARLDIGMQGHIEFDADGVERYKEQVTVVNFGPSTASQVIVEVEHGGTFSGQGIGILPQGQIFTATWDCQEKDITQINLHWNDDRGIAQSKSWGPDSPSWPLMPWLMRVMVARDRTRRH